MIPHGGARWRRPWVGLVLGLTLLLGATACDASGGASSASPTAPARRAAITYRVTGNAPSVSIVFGNKHHARTVDARLPWSHTGSAFVGTTVVLTASQPRSGHGYRVACTLTVTLPGREPVRSTDSSHIVGVKAEGGSQAVLYDGTCVTSQVLSATGL
jgi:hypothetical protein